MRGNPSLWLVLMQRARVTPIIPPSTLEAAIKSRFAGDLGLSSDGSALYQGTAGDKCTDRYVVFTVARGSTIRTTDVSLWRDATVKFCAFAPTEQDAEALIAKVMAAFDGAAFTYVGGYAIPLVQADRGQMPEKARGRGGSRLFGAWVAYSARCQQPR